MLKILRISNKKISIDNIEILTYIKKFNNIKYNDMLIYEVDEICFCGAMGKLIVYVVQGKIYKLAFSCINMHNIFGISPDFDAYNTFLAEMEENYRQQNKNEFYNKRFEFKILKNDNNFVTIIRGRDYAVNEI